jgi:hypothetical protein
VSDASATATPPAAHRTAAEPEAVREAGRLRVPVLAGAADPGDGVRPGSEAIVNTLSLDPSLYGHDAAQARERFARLRRPFAFALDAVQAARVPGLPTGYLAVVTREPLAGDGGDDAWVVRANGRLEVVRGDVFTGAAPPEALRAAGLGDATALRAALVGRIDLLLPDVRR